MKYIYLTFVTESIISSNGKEQILFFGGAFLYEKKTVSKLKILKRLQLIINLDKNLKNSKI